MARSAHGLPRPPLSGRCRPRIADMSANPTTLSGHDLNRLFTEACAAREADRCAEARDTFRPPDLDTFTWRRVQAVKF